MCSEGGGGGGVETEKVITLNAKCLYMFSSELTVETSLF